MKDKNRHFYVSVALFAIATPLGVLIGAFLHDVDAIFTVICNGLAAGTFIYISCSEILVSEFEKKEAKWAKLASFVGGGGVIALLWLTH